MLSAYGRPPRCASHIVAVLVLVLVAVSTVVALWLWLAPRASSPSGAPRVASVRVEAVKAYALAGYGTYIGIYTRNVGETSARIKTLEENGILVEVYDPQGDLIAVNNSARIVREGVPDGIWEPEELVVIEAFVPVVLNGVASLDVPGAGYKILLYFGGRNGRPAATATLAIHNIIVVNSTVCGLLLKPGYSLVVQPASIGDSEFLCSEEGAASIVGKPLISIHLEGYVLNDTFSIRVSGVAPGDKVSIIDEHNYENNVGPLLVDATVSNAATTLEVKAKNNVASRSGSGLAGGRISIDYSVYIGGYYKTRSYLTDLIIGSQRIPLYAITYWATFMSRLAGVGSSGSMSLEINLTEEFGYKAPLGRAYQLDDESPSPVKTWFKYSVSENGYTISSVKGSLLLEKLVVTLYTINGDCKLVPHVVAVYEGGAARGISLNGVRTACVAIGARGFTPPWRSGG